MSSSNSRALRHSVLSAVGIGILALVGCGDAGSKSVGHTGVSRAASIGTAPDPTAAGTLPTTSSEYQFPEAVDPDVLAGSPTELWARVYRPTTLTSAHPVLIFLHGNHGTCGTGSNPRVDGSCQYTSTGTCPAGYVVSPSHNGYGYVADKLASYGYVVVSINANRSITCGSGDASDPYLILARGKLVLKHLQRLTEWNATAGATPDSVGTDLAGKLDFSNVGLMGHSRGGEGVRAAYNFFRAAGSPWPARFKSTVKIKGIFEIGPVDGQAPTKQNADGTNWNVLLPACDGDVSDLQGIKPYDRMMAIDETPAAPKSHFMVWGTNHNYYNTEWQQSDSTGCGNHTPIFTTGAGVSGSTKQQSTGAFGMMAFFRGFVGASADAKYAQLFNPQYDLPGTLTSITRVDRGYTDSPSSTVSLSIEDFSGVVGTGLSGLPTTSAGITQRNVSAPWHDPSLKIGLLSWTAAGAGVYYQNNFDAVGADLSGYSTLDMRLDKYCCGTAGLSPSAINFSVRLVNGDDTLSDPLKVGSYGVNLTDAAQSTSRYQMMFQTARITLADFTGATLTAIKGVRLTFDDTPKGDLLITNIVASTGAPTPFSLEPVAASMINNPDVPRIQVYTNENATNVVRMVSTDASPSGLAVEVKSSVAFPVRDEIAVLNVGGVALDWSSYAPSGDTHTLTFNVTPEQRAQIKDGAPVSLAYGRSGASNVRWEFGGLVTSAK